MNGAIIESLWGKRTLRQWKEARKKPSWAFGLATVLLALLLSADLVMLGDALGQSFGGMGHVVVVALLAGFAGLPFALAHYLHDLLTEWKEAASESRGLLAVRVTVCALLLATTIVGYVSVTDYRLSQEEANSAKQEQTSGINQQSGAMDISAFTGSGDSVTASPESQTFLLTTILVMSSVYSFALSWAKESQKRDKPEERLSQALPYLRAESELVAEKAARAKEGEVINDLLSAIESYEAATIALEGAKVLIGTIDGPNADQAAAQKIRWLVAQAANTSKSQAARVKPDTRLAQRHFPKTRTSRQPHKLTRPFKHPAIKRRRK